MEVIEWQKDGTTTATLTLELPKRAGKAELARKGDITKVVNQTRPSTTDAKQNLSAGEKVKTEIGISKIGEIVRIEKDGFKEDDNMATSGLHTCDTVSCHSLV